MLSSRTDIGREEPNLVGLRDRLRQREEDVAALRRNVDEKSQSWSVLCSNSYRKSHGKWPTLPPAPQNPIRWGLKVALLVPTGPEVSLLGNGDDTDMLGETGRTAKKTRVEDPAPPTDPS